MYYITIIDTVLTLIVPFLLLTVMNFMIARSIYLFYARYRQQRAFCREGYPMRVFINPLPSKQNGSGSTLHATQSGSNVITPVTQMSVTRMLLLVSTVFILLNLPSYVLRIYVFLLYFGDAESLEAASGSLAYILQRYCMILYYTNFAINFVLYNASSRMFRVTLCDYARNRWLAFRNSIVRLRNTLSHSSTSQNDVVIM
ncbi:uncharacterized protein LOC120843614 [Ixodes scapularis]|uniref:uncharacterized protein LOC120843614 n=1 Tax=Ixodes scapularis TaxID=6945 RepID=UPI001A9DD780|nr:uncharacterized protein LOC120843614 [Ixodes scapularis]